MALALPAAVKDELARAIDSLEQHVAGARWVPKENLHLTLAFLGRVDDGRLGEISAAVANTVQGHVDFTVRMGALGAFPSVRRARVIWAGLDDPTQGLSGLAESVAESLEPVGFTRDARAFRPHVTLARLKAPARIDLNETLESIAFPVKQITLFESHLGRPHAVYSEVAIFPFTRRS